MVDAASSKRKTRWQRAKSLLRRAPFVCLVLALGASVWAGFAALHVRTPIIQGVLTVALLLGWCVTLVLSAFVLSPVGGAGAGDGRRLLRGRSVQVVSSATLMAVVWTSEGMLAPESALAGKVAFCAGMAVVVLAEVWLIVSAMSSTKGAASTYAGRPEEAARITADGRRSAAKSRGVAVHITMCALLLGSLLVLVTALSAGREQVTYLAFIALLLLVTGSRMVYTQP